MEPNPQKPNVNPKSVQPSVFAANPNYRDKIHKHLTDINDVITEEDIRRMTIEIPAASSTSRKKAGEKKN
ncbi:MAG: hypothetical protein IT254_04375 [Chitinophagaceae bacterium]|nr:hypothetical protein [Bacteroidota bacterium]MCC6257534.1 hypothetical protein [Chitinophagaceae bacterium]MCW5915953.1 hypothetical protein [Ferruginibacter sp.]